MIRKFPRPGTLLLLTLILVESAAPSIAQGQTLAVITGRRSSIRWPRHRSKMASS